MMPIRDEGLNQVTLSLFEAVSPSPFSGIPPRTPSGAFPAWAAATDRLPEVHRPQDPFPAGRQQPSREDKPRFAPELGTPLLGSGLPLAHSLKVTAPRGEG